MKITFGENFERHKQITKIDENEVLHLSMKYVNQLTKLLHEKNLREEEIMGLYMLLEPEVQRAILGITESKIHEGMSQDDGLIFFQDQVEKSFNAQFPEKGDRKIN